MRVLLDTNVLVSTAIKPEGKPAQIFQRAATRFELVCSEYILEELADVMARPHIQKKYKALVAPERREQFIALVRFLAVMVEVQTTLDLVSDEADNQVLAGAVDGRTDFLVTGDPHLLALQQYEGCKIVSPDQFLAVLQKEEQTD
jgi:putative PIN family toxin of toxin-antitoxin system